MTLTPDFATRSEIFGVLLGLMVLNLVAMLFAKPILKYAGMPLQLLGTVLGIIQVALGLQIIVLGVARVRNSRKAITFKRHRILLFLVNSGHGRDLSGYFGTLAGVAAHDEFPV